MGESLVIAAFSAQATDYLDDQEIADTKAEICDVAIQLRQLRPNVEPGVSCEVPESDDRTPAGGSSSDQPVGTEADNDRLIFVDAQIVFYSDLAQCEQYPEAFTPERRAELRCSGRPGNGPARETALNTLAQFQAEKDEIQARMTEAQAAQQDVTAAEAAAEAQAVEDARIAAASPQAESLANLKLDLEDRLNKLQTGTTGDIYGLNERFVATETAVDPWIRWGLRLLFVAVDMTPVLLKMAMGTSTVDQVVAIRRRMSLYPHLQSLRETEEAFRLGEDVRVHVPEPKKRSKPLFTVRAAARRWWQERMANARTDSDDLVVKPDRPPSGAEPKPPQDAGPSGPVSSDPEPKDTGGREHGELVTIDNRSFFLESKVGEGNFAEIWFASPANPAAFEHDYEVVAKIPRRDSASKKQLAAEYDMYKRLASVGGVPQLVSGDTLGLVLRYYPRTSIDRWYYSAQATNHWFSYRDAMQWMWDIIATLEAVWQQGFVHGDGKPSNLVLEGDEDPGRNQPDQFGNVLMIDFGSVVRIGQDFRSISPGYVPPELLGGSKRRAVTPLCDVFSFLGGTFYYLFSGGVAPWQDQVEGLWGPEDQRTQLRGRRADRVKNAWVKQSTESPLTSLSLLNQNVAPSVDALLNRWMESDPYARLGVGGSGTDQTRNGELWDPRQLAEDLKSQVRALHTSLLAEIGDEQLSVPYFGERHPFAPPPEDVPDLTIDRNNIVDDAETEEGY